MELFCSFFPDVCRRGRFQIEINRIFSYQRYQRPLEDARDLQTFAKLHRTRACDIYKIMISDQSKIFWPWMVIGLPYNHCKLILG